MVEGVVTLWRLKPASRSTSATAVQWSCTLVRAPEGLRMEIARDGSPWLRSAAPTDEQLRRIAEAYKQRLVKSGWIAARS